MGLGSVQIRTTEFQLKDPPDGEVDKRHFITEGFKTLGVPELDSVDISELKHIQQLREMLWLPNKESHAPVRYPELDSKDKTIPCYIDMVRKQIPETGANNPKYLEPKVRLGILQHPWRPWHPGH